MEKADFQGVRVALIAPDHHDVQGIADEVVAEVAKQDALGIGCHHWQVVVDDVGIAEDGLRRLAGSCALFSLVCESAPWLLPSCSLVSATR